MILSPFFTLTHRRSSLLLLAAGINSFVFAKIPTRITLSQDCKSQIQSTKTIVAFQNKELGTFISASAGISPFGLIGGIINVASDKSRKSTAETEVIPVRNSLAGYDPTNTLLEAIKTELGSVSWLKKNILEVQPLPTPNTLSTWVNECNADVLLFIRVEYKLTPNFDGIAMVALVTIHPRTSPLIDHAQPHEPLPGTLFYDYIVTTYTFPDWLTPISNRLKESAKIWAENNGQRARVAIDDGMRELAKMIAFDVEDSSKSYSGPPKAKWLTRKFHGNSVDGYVVHDANGRVWMRDRFGALSSASPQ